MGLETDKIQILLRECTARVRVGGFHKGTAFFVGPGRLLTCAHVVTKDGKMQPDITLSWYQNGQYESFSVDTVVVAQAAHVDLALITLAPPIPDHHPSACLSKLVSIRDELTSFGYPENYDQGDGATYEVEGFSQTHGVALLKFKNGRADFGMSGSPLLADRLRSVCAVLTTSSDPKGASGGHATPIERAFVEWPELRQWQKAGRQQDRRWNDLLPLPLWQQAESAQQERLFRNDLHQRSSVQPLPLAKHWESFLAQSPWHAWVQGEMLELEKCLAQVRSTEEEFAGIPAIDYTRNYDGIVSELRPVVMDLPNCIRAKLNTLDQTKRDLVRKRDQPDAKDAEPDLEAQLHNISSLIHSFVEVRRRADDLADEISDPSFDRCFLILGEMGSGKTHFLSSLLTKGLGELDQSMVVALMRPREIGQGTLRDHLLEMIRDRTGIRWESLSDFDAYLLAIEPPATFVVAVDDLQTADQLPNFLAEMKSLISESTQLHSLYWAIVIDHQSYFQIAASGPFWRNYGYVRRHDQPRDRLGAWLNLDELSTRAEIGLRIIRQILEADKSSSFGALFDFNHLSARTRQQLNIPFIAWSLLDVRSSLPVGSMVDLNFTDFIEQFWTSLLPRLTEDVSIQQRLETCVALIATYLVDTGDYSPLQSALFDALTTKAKQKSDLADAGNLTGAIQLLEAGGLLRQFNVKDPDFGSIRKVELTFDVFWNWRIGTRLGRELELAHTKGASSTEFLESWFQKNGGGQAARSGILQFLLLSLDTPTVGTEDRSGLRSIWQWAISSSAAPSGAAWFAAAKAKRSTQDRLATWLLRPLPTLHDEEQDLFALVYFLTSLSSSPPKGFTAAEIFKLLNPHYESLNKTSLSDYFLYAVHRWLPRATTIQDVVETMVQFTGCEVMGVGEVVASLSVDALERFEKDPKRLVMLILGYLKEISKSWLPKATAKERYLYRAWVLHEFCRRLIKNDKLDAYSVLSKAGWYRASALGIKTMLAHEMIRETNFAFADWYKETWPTPHEKYLKLVSDLAESRNCAEREAAYFMIRHTVATHEQIAARVDDSFRPVLTRIAPEIIRLHPQHRGFFRANHVAY